VLNKKIALAIFSYRTSFTVFSCTLIMVASSLILLCHALHTSVRKTHS
jgi:hypothetical protein